MTPGTPPDDVWADERVVVGPSRIDDRGLFARETIAVGTVVLRLGGRLVTSNELAQLIAGGPYVDSITVDEDAHLVLPPATIAHFGNHSCDPNLWHVGAYELATRRRVRAGEELTLDYATNSGAEGFEMECRCGSEQCRGRVTSEDWRLPVLQAQYRGHWTPALQRRIDQG